MKKILGLDLGTTSIGWAYVNEAQTTKEKSSIIKTGVRVVPLSTDEKNDFKKGKSITINADRTLKRGARRNHFRYKLRRQNLIEELNRIGFINAHTILTEDGSDSTNSTYLSRSKAITQKITKEEFARVLLTINKKRGYKSSRKTNKLEEGEIVDGMEVAKKLHQENLTPGQYTLVLIKNNKKKYPDYYRSDLQNEFDLIWNFQQQIHPEILTSGNHELLVGKNQSVTRQFFEKNLQLERVDLKGTQGEKRLQTLNLRVKGLDQKLTTSEFAHVFTELNKEISNSSGYLGEISDRSKELFFNNQTVGQFQNEQLIKSPGAPLKNQVFYRQDYINEFDAIWEQQAKFYPELTNSLKDKIKNKIIFYQRRLKSQKGLISYCEFESWEQDVLVDGIKTRKTVGQRVIPRSSPLFQQFKVWHNINSLRVTNTLTSEEFTLDEDTKQLLFQELNWSDKWTKKKLMERLGFKDKDWTLNFENIEGNRTNARLLSVYKEILLREGYDNIKFKNLNSSELLDVLRECFSEIGIAEDVLLFDPSIKGNAFSKQKSYLLWHLLYSYEEDDSETGLNSLIKSLTDNFGFKVDHARILARIVFDDDYGNLSARAIRKILPYLQDGMEYPKACGMAGYNHSSSITTSGNENRQLDEKLDVLKKNSLRNPVVEKILNQMINIVNAILEDESLGRPDEIRIELARELKKTSQQREDMTKAIAKQTRDYEEYREIIKKEFGIPYVSRNDLIKYRLYKELKPNGYKTIYSNTYIEPKDLFSPKFDVEHIIPKARLFDDSYSNKTLETREDNINKGDETALDYVSRQYGSKAAEEYIQRIEDLFKGKHINFTKRKKLLMGVKDIPEDFIARDLGTSAFIAKRSAEILFKVTRKVTVTSGLITSRLREDWGLVNVLQELNWDKYNKLGLTYHQENKNGKLLRRIKDWTKRNDHRHHAMDAITVAFTKPVYIQYLNNLNSRTATGEKTRDVYAIEQKYTFRDEKRKRRFIAPFPGIRSDVKQQLESLLVSHKAKNKVTTKNKNKIRVQGKNPFKTKIEETPRGQLHKETMYGQSKSYVTKTEKIGTAFSLEKVNTVANKKYREALKKRLGEFNNDPKKAFSRNNSLSKNPIYINETQEVIPEKVKTVRLEDRFTIRKDVAADLKIDKVIDKGVREALKRRLEKHNGNAKEAFSNLEENPIWLNEENKIPIKRVKITGVNEAISLHHKKDHQGNVILTDGRPTPTDYVSTGNNHHVAIYKDEKGNLQEEVVSFYEAVIRKNHGDSIIRKNHPKGWEFLFSMKQNEMFILPSEDFIPEGIDLLDQSKKSLISKHLFRVQSLSTKYYVFNHHLETEAANGETFKNKKTLSGVTYHYFQSEKHLMGVLKVRLNHLGDIVQIGEY